MKFEPGERVEISGKTAIVLDYTPPASGDDPPFYYLLMLDSGLRLAEPDFKLKPVGTFSTAH